MTGRRVHYDAELLPKNGKMQPFSVDDITNDVDGFSPNSQIRFAFAGGVAGPLAGIDDIGASLAADATIVLLDVESGERVPYFAELDATAQDGEAMTVFVRPARRLGYDRHYGVGVRGLTDAGGAAIVPSPLFRALRDELGTDLEEAIRMADRVLVLLAGRVVFDGPPAALAARAAGRAWLDPGPPPAGGWPPGRVRAFRQRADGGYRCLGTPPAGAVLDGPTVEDGYLLLASTDR